jgi:hypothetical protein
MGFLLPSAHQDLAVHLPRALPRPATFRLQGLVTLLAAYSRRARAGFLSHRRRSWDSPFGVFPSRKVSGAFADGWTRIPFNLSVFPTPEGVRPAQQASVSGLRPFRESLAAKRGLTRRPLDTPLGFALLGLASQSLAWDHSHTPLTCFAATDPKISATGTAEYQSALAWPHPRHSASRAHGRGNPSRVLAPPRSRALERATIRAMSSPLAAPHIAADSPAIFGWLASLDRSCPGYA